MSELAIVSARTARLKVLADRGSRGAMIAMRLAEEPGRFLSSVQIGITLVGVLSGAFSGATLGARLSAALLEAGRLALLAEEQAEQLAIAAPKVEFVDRYVDTAGSMSFRQVAKLLKANERVLRQLLLDGHVMYRLNGALTPYQNHIDAGRFE